MSRKYVSRKLRRSIHSAAKLRCGYCCAHLHNVGQIFHLEHIIPEAAGGLTIKENLWLSCPLCNSFKNKKTFGVDPETKEEVPLFNPRTQRWLDHFKWSEDGTRVIGLTPIGRGTVIALRLNYPLAVIVRKRWVLSGDHPPAD